MSKPTAFLVDVYLIMYLTRGNTERLGGGVLFDGYAYRPLCSGGAKIWLGVGGGAILAGRGSQF